MTVDEILRQHRVAEECAAIRQTRDDVGPPTRLQTWSEYLETFEATLEQNLREVES